MQITSLFLVLFLFLASCTPALSPTESLSKAQAAIKASQWNEASIYLKNVLQQDNSEHDAHARYLLAGVYFQLGDLENAVRFYEQAYSKGFEQESSALKLANAAFSLGDFARLD